MRINNRSVYARYLGTGMRGSFSLNFKSKGLPALVSDLMEGRVRKVWEREGERERKRQVGG